MLLIAAWAGDGKAQTLEDALTAAYLNNPTLLAARARLRATDEQVPQAIANWRPNVEVSSSVSRTVTRSTDTWRTPRDVAATLTQPLFRGGRTIAATRGAENTVKAERARLSSVEQDIMLSAATAYLDVFRDEAVLGLNINNEQVLQRQLEATRDRFEVGEITRTDVHQAEARLSRAKADRIEAEGLLKASRAAYRNVVGQPAPEGLAPPPKLPDRPGNLSEAVKQASTNNPAVLVAEFDRLASQDFVDETRGELLPEVEVELGVRRDWDGSSSTSNSREEAITARVTVPLYQQGAVYSRLREAKQTVAQRQQDIDQARRDAVEDATRSWESLVSASAQVKALKTQIDASVVALEGVQREAQVGSRTVLDVLDAEQELLDARSNHIGARRNELVTLFELRRATGQLGAKDLNLPVGYYDPTEHYHEVRDKWFGGSSQGQGGSAQ